MAPAETSRCAVHPQVAAVDVCTRCGAFACGECVAFSPGPVPLPYCAACHRREFGESASARAVMAQVLGVMSLVLFWPLGVLAWALGARELAAIERGEAPPLGRKSAQRAVTLGKWAVRLLVGVVLAGLTVLIPELLSRR